MTSLLELLQIRIKLFIERHDTSPQPALYGASLTILFLNDCTTSIRIEEQHVKLRFSIRGRLDCVP